jgi:hypothetical protein
MENTDAVPETTAAAASETTPASTPPMRNTLGEPKVLDNSPKVVRKKDPQKVAAGRKGAAARAAKARERVLAELDAEKLKIYEEAEIKRAQTQKTSVGPTESPASGSPKPKTPSDSAPSDTNLGAPCTNLGSPKLGGGGWTPGIAILACFAVAGIAVLALRRTAPPAPAPVPKPPAPTPSPTLVSGAPIHVKQRDPFDM